MNPYIDNIEEQTLKNETFRTVLFTTEKSQLVVMSLQPGEDIGAEVHEIDQFIRVESGSGESVLAGSSYPVSDGTAILVPAGVEHNVKNTGTTALKLYTIYMPPEHREGTVHQTKDDALADTEDHYNVT